MKILIVIDKEGTAIWRLASSIKRNLLQHQVVILPVHPKRSDIDTITKAQELMAWCDVLDVHYWKSGQVLRKTFPKEFEKKTKILFHFNPYDVENEENKYYDKVVVNNEEIYNKAPYAYLVPMGIDLGFFKFNNNYTNEKVVNMSVARIEGKKGVREVAQVCNELGYKLRLVGRVSKPDYMREVLEVGGKNIEFLEDASDEKLREVYYSSAVHICNSIDNFESGTLPILENMACGIPVLTRAVGHVFDLANGENMVVRKGKTEDVEDLKESLKELMENKEWRLKLREKAWETVKNRDDRRMAQEINKLYYSIFIKDFPLVSVIIPVRGHAETFVDCLVGALSQNYPKYEVIISDSGDVPIKEIVDEAIKRSPVPIKYIYFPNKGEYTLPEARNRAIIEADGEYILFCDDRIKMEPEAIATFEAHRKSNVWIWGMKDGVIKGFVENFSFVPRDVLVKGGMFNERMQYYGGMTQEIRERYETKLGVNFVFLQEAKANQIRKAGSKSNRRDDIIEAKYLIYKIYGK